MARRGLIRTFRKLSAVMSTVGITFASSCARNSSTTQLEQLSSPLPDNISLCAHMTVEYSDGRTIKWTGGRKLAACDYVDLNTGRTGTATFSGFETTMESGVVNDPVEDNPSGEAWAKAISNDVPTTYKVNGYRMGKFLPVAVQGIATFTPMGNESKEISGITVETKKFRIKAGGCSMVGCDDVKNTVTIYASPGGGYVPGDRIEGPGQSQFCRVLARPLSEVRVISITPTQKPTVSGGESG